MRFFVLLGLFATGTQLVALAGALELFFAGWEMIGIASAFFIGFFHERGEPVRSAVRAFATYRLSDAGSADRDGDDVRAPRFGAVLRVRSGGQPAAGRIHACIALLFLLSAMGKSAQLPFSGWLPRAMEGPTPSSALFYGAVSIHAGLFLLLRVWPVLEVSIVARARGRGRSGSPRRSTPRPWSRVHTDAKGALAHATLAQVGLILAEICLGWTTLALVHLVCHAFLRLGQYSEGAEHHPRHPQDGSSACRCRLARALRRRPWPRACTRRRCIGCAWTIASTGRSRRSCALLKRSMVSIAGGVARCRQTEPPSECGGGRPVCPMGSADRVLGAARSRRRLRPSVRCPRGNLADAP